jgi:predicted transcriptional regulator
MTARINARLDPALARRIRRLGERTGRSTTEIVKASLEAYLAAEEEASEPARLLSGLVGIGSGPADLSERYKEHLGQGLRRKHR